MKVPLLVVPALLCFARVVAAADFTVITPVNTGPGSLRQAILDANALPGLDRIIFNIPGAGPHRITILPDGLPNVTDPVIIDGYTQPGATPNTLADGNNAVIKIQVDGGWYDQAEGIDRALVITAGGSTVRGLSITGLQFISASGQLPDGGAIELSLNGGNTIEGNFIGITPDGSSSRDNPVGIRIFSHENTIGGTSPAARNLISGNYYGVIVHGGNGNRVSGNFIGTDPSGTETRGNYTGILVLGGHHTGTVIGGTMPGAGNLISGNQIHGIQLGFPGNGGQQDFLTDNVVIQGNLIGTKVNGVDALYNVNDGINILGSHNLIGGLEPGAGNVIRSTGFSGLASNASVAVTPGPDSFPSKGNRILSNQIWGTIDLGDDGPNSNDLGDTDTGPNDLQNFPILTAVDPPAANGDVTIHGELNSIPSSNFLLQFFFQKYPMPVQHLGNTSVTTTAGGRGRFSFVAQGLGTIDPNNAAFFASATDSAGNTSELGGGAGVVHMANISTRAQVGTGDNVLIGGFVIHSDHSPKKVIVRALGPSLNVSNRLPDPYLELYDEQGTLIAKNDDWRSSQQEVMTSGIPPSSDLESAIVATLHGGSYTAQMRDVDGRSGLGVIEIYDLDSMPTAFFGLRRLVNLSTRGFVGNNDNVLIGGLIVRGDTVQRLIIRAIGPDLTAVGLPNALPDPTLELRDESGTLLASNDDWRSSQEEEIEETNLAPNDDRDSAIKAVLPPGSYTAIVRGKQNQTGLGLVEFYTLVPRPITLPETASSGGQ
jgi:hypothetical protein